MSAEQETKNTEETQVGGNLDAAGSASGAASVGASGSQKKSEEQRRKPKKLGQKGGQSNGNTPQKEEGDGEADGGSGGGDDNQQEAPSTPTPQAQPPKMEQQSRSKSRQASRGRGRPSSQPPSDTDSAYRSDVSQKGGRRNRNRNRGKGQAQAQAQQQGGGGGGGPLDAVDEVGETVNGVVDGAQGAVDNTVGNVGKAVGKPHEALGGLLHTKGGNEDEDKKDDEENEQLRLRLDLNLDIEVQLKAKIHGDLTLGLLYVLTTSVLLLLYQTIRTLTGAVPHSSPCPIPIPFPGLRRHVSTYGTDARRDDPYTTWRSSPGHTSASDTIYALSSAPGRAAIAVIRLSGPACLDVYQKLCPGRPLPKPRTATLRKLYRPDNHDSEPQPQPQSHPQSLADTDRVLDTGALVLYFPAPNSVTGEDVLEFHVHGGPAIVRSVFQAISACATKSGSVSVSGSAGNKIPIRPAEPGEFTKRAFYNGRVDLTQAEALGETLAAETEQQRRLAVGGTDGGASSLAARYESWRKMLLYARGEMEALIDFSEDQHFDESPTQFMASVATQVETLKRQIEIHIMNANKGELLRNGISVALLGAPNAGKSSLLNRIVGREAAIVSAEPGTTRDIVDVSVDLGGWLCRLGDMAGLRGGRKVEAQTSGSNPTSASVQQGHSTITTAGGSTTSSSVVGQVEQEGIRRARERALQSDVVVVLLAVEKVTSSTSKNAGDGSGFGYGSGYGSGSLDDFGFGVPINDEVVDAVADCHAAGKTILVVLNKVDLLVQNHTQSDSSHHAINRFVQKIRARFPMVPAHRICMISCREAAEMEVEATTATTPMSVWAQSDPGGIQSFLAQLTGAFKELTCAATGSSLDDMNTDSLTPAEAQSYWTASLSVTHRQSMYLRQCLDHLDDFLDQCQPPPSSDDDANHYNYNLNNGNMSTADVDVDVDVAHAVRQPPGASLLQVSPLITDDSVDIVTAAEHLRFAADCLAKITGIGEGGDVEDVLGVVFEK
ncbi:tRNA modification GTPase MnmE [Exophiala dermatitidis]